jgi:nitrogen-specific signal transduction histidine kinase
VRSIAAGDRDITPPEHGSGLGLWLVNWIVETHDAHIGFEVDAGTTAVVGLHRADGE